jgi:hypothetical protein
MARNSSKPAEKKAGQLTEYVVLRQAQVREEPAEENPVIETAWLPVIKLVNEGTPDAGWQIVTFAATSKSAAIRQHTGEGADVIEGTWKAIPLSSWKGGETTKRVTAAARLPIEEALA